MLISKSLSCIALLHIKHQLWLVASGVGRQDVTPQVTAGLPSLPELPNLQVDPLVETGDIKVEISKLGWSLGKLSADEVWVHCGLS